MENKTKTFKFRVTQLQLDELKRRSKSFGTITNFINQAVKEFSDSTAKEKLDREKHIAEQYVAIDAKLAHVGGNLNQAMRRINERVVAGLDTSGLLSTQLRSEVQNCTDLCIELRKTLKDVTYKVLKDK